MSNQLSHKDFKVTQVKKPIILVAENIRTPENMGMIFRVAEAFGVIEIIFTGIHGIELSTKAKRASRSTYQRIKYSFNESSVDCLLNLHSQGFSSIALEITEESNPIQNFDFSEFDNIALIIGSERQGISEESLEIVSKAVHIPLYGANSSINVVSALAIALQEITRV